MKKILITVVTSLSLVAGGLAIAQKIPNPADKPELGKPSEQCYKKGKLKKNRVVWDGKCYVKPDCGQGYYYGPSIGGCMQDNGGGE